MVVSTSTNQVRTKLSIRSYAHVFCHSESDTSGVAPINKTKHSTKENENTTHLCLKDTCQGIADPALAPPTIRSVAENADFIHDGTLAE